MFWKFLGRCHREDLFSARAILLFYIKSVLETVVGGLAGWRGDLVSQVGEEWEIDTGGRRNVEMGDTL